MAKKQFPSDKQDQFMIRMPDGMRASLKEIAAMNGRSLNAEIVERLGKSMDFPAISLTPELHDQVIELPLGILSDLQVKLQRLVEAEIGNALLSHQISQKNLLSRFDEFIEYAPEEEQPRLRQELHELFIKVGIYRDTPSIKFTEDGE